MWQKLSFWLILSAESCILHPVSCIIYPLSFILYHLSFILYVYCIWCILYHYSVSGILCSVSYSSNCIMSCLPYPVSSILYTVYIVSCTLYFFPESCILYSVSCILYLISCRRTENSPEKNCWYCSGEMWDCKDCFSNEKNRSRD